MMKNLIASNAYKDLISNIQVTLSSGFLAVQKELEYQRVKTYWEIGRDIRSVAGLSGGALILGEELYKQISIDINRRLGLNLTSDTIRRAIQFNKVYPKFPKKTTLTFTHYLALMRVADVKKRLQLEKKASRENMPTDRLIDEVVRLNEKRHFSVNTNIKKLVVERGEPFVYQIYSDRNSGGKKVFRLDCGFKINLALNGRVLYRKISTVTTQSRTVRVVKNDGTYSVRLNRKRKLKPYTYPARVVRVVDGDTLDARVDVGFGIGLNERFRLRGINTPEINTYEGKRAKRFLTKHLSKCPAIIIRTNKEGMYGRWLADVFTLAWGRDPYKIAAEGEYVNQLLLDEGLAELYKK